MRQTIAALATAAVLLGCGSEESKMERGIAPEAEEAVPSADAEFDMSEAERRARIAAEEAREEKKAFDEAVGEH